MTIVLENYSPKLDFSIESDSEEDDVPVKKENYTLKVEVLVKRLN